MNPPIPLGLALGGCALAVLGVFARQAIAFALGFLLSLLSLAL